MIFITVRISWNNKKCFDTIDAWCKHEGYYKMLQYLVQLLKCQDFHSTGIQINLLEPEFYI